jgi:DNA-binding NarL/FixJ family response regulator
MHPDQTYASRALEAGASAYVLKHSASDELVTAIREALRGGRFLSRALRTEATEELLSQTRPRLKETIELTGRQREVVQLLAEGKSAKQIAAILHISPRTVETHKYKIMDDLGLKTSAEVVQYAIKHGIVSF